NLAYNCSPSFNWKKHFDDAQITSFQKERAAMGYAFQSITRGGCQAVSHSMLEPARGHHERALTASVARQVPAVACERGGYTAPTRELAASTETAQFHSPPPRGGAAPHRHRSPAARHAPPENAMTALTTTTSPPTSDTSGTSPDDDPRPGSPGRPAPSGTLRVT